MPEYRRSGVKGGTYFFTVTTYQRQPLLLEPTARAALCEAIESVNAKLSFTVEAWVLLSDHLHCLCTLPVGDADFPKRWGMIKRHVSRRCATTWNPPLSASRRHRHEGIDTPNWGSAEQVNEMSYGE